MRAAIAHRICQPPMCGGSLRPWAPLIVPAALNDATLAVMLPALVALNMNYLVEHPDTPPLYSAGVWYEAEPPGEEQWLTIPWCLKRRDMGRGVDCEDLACWRVAELRLRLGERAEAFAVRHETPKGFMYHIRVRRGILDPRTKLRMIEDPSKLLGMNADPNEPRGDASIYTETQTRQNPHAFGSWFYTSIADGDKF